MSTFFDAVKEMFFPKQDTVVQKSDHSCLSKPGCKYYRPMSKNDITKKALEENIEARDDEELFLSIVEGYCTTRMDLVRFDRAWRLIMRENPELRGVHWEERQKKAELFRKNV